MRACWLMLARARWADGSPYVTRRIAPFAKELDPHVGHDYRSAGTCRQTSDEEAEGSNHGDGRYSNARTPAVQDSARAVDRLANGGLRAACSATSDEALKPWREVHRFPLRPNV